MATTVLCGLGLVAVLGLATNTMAQDEDADAVVAGTSGLPPLPSGLALPPEVDADDAEKRRAFNEDPVAVSAWQTDPRNQAFFRNAYPIDVFRLAYVPTHPGQPPIAQLMSVEFDLIPTAGGYIARTTEYPLPGYPVERHTLSDTFDPDIEFTLHALRFAVIPALVDRLDELDLLGFFVGISNDSVSVSTGADQRENRTGPDRNAMDFVIFTGTVDRLRSFAFGDRIPAAEREDNKRHARILRNSPIQPYDGGDGGREDLLRRRELNEYALLLSRHPGRRLDVAIAGEPADGIELHYMINENNPLRLYAQASNTGTEETDKWRYRFGLIHNQLTGNDDILNIDYLTAGFDEVHAVVGSYDTRIFDSDRLRLRIGAAWSQYTASDVGFASEVFTGESYGVSAELAYNFYQYDNLFLDAIAGFRWENNEVENKITDTRGSTDMYTGYGGVRLERNNERYDTRGYVGFAYTDGGDVEGLGRLFPSDNWVTMQFDASHAFYLEPVLNPEGWRDASDASNSTLAHEIALNVRGLVAFDDDRLVPQAERVVGGLFSVRGYPESVMAGDTVIIASAEYRYHVPRAFKPEAQPRAAFGQQFRYAPQYIYGRPDWDLVLRGFVDVGHVEINDKQTFEQERTLVGTGLGVELLLKQNINLRMDWGVALQDLDSAGVSSGSNRFHFLFTLLY